jgi:DnaJ-class molecular chaperone
MIRRRDPESICPTCNGSGEGMFDGTRCPDCAGHGTGPAEDDYDLEPDDLAEARSRLWQRGEESGA